MNSVHDSRIIRYSVSAKEQTIVIETENRDRAIHEFTDIYFLGVLAYCFEHDLFGAIIFDVEEVDLTALLDANAQRFEDGAQWGWPRGWEKRKETIQAYTARLGMRAFELSSSYGMSGWVIGKEMRMISKAANQSTDPTLASGTPLAGPESCHP
jgi:hypothetical protein